jgi:hypothetical protein
MRDMPIKRRQRRPLVLASSVLAAAVIASLGSLAPASAAPGDSPNSAAGPTSIWERTTTIATATTPWVRTTSTATGTFVFRTGNGILSTWDSEGLRLTGVSPGSATTSALTTSANVSLPIVAKSGSTNFAAGGFRITNTTTGEFVNCATPAIDTRARVVDCVLRDGTNMPLFAMTTVKSRTFVRGAYSTTAFYRGITLRVDGQTAADFLNDELSTNVFSPYVTVATGELVVTYPL